jgi:hypothetical protein
MITTYNDQPCFNANEIMNTLYLNAFVFERERRVVNQRLVVDCNRVRKRCQSYVGEFGGRQRRVLRDLEFLPQR